MTIRSASLSPYGHPHAAVPQYGRRYHREGTIMKKLSMIGIVGGAVLLAAVPLSLQWSQVGPAVPLLTVSHANAQYYGPHRRHVRRVDRWVRWRGTLPHLSGTVSLLPCKPSLDMALLLRRSKRFDYGCGRGDDIRGLAANGIAAYGWDPHYAPEPIPISPGVFFVFRDKDLGQNFLAGRHRSVTLLQRLERPEPVRVRLSRPEPQGLRR